MLVQFFTIPIHGGDEHVEELNHFLAAHRIVTLDREFVEDGPNSVWALCVTYVQASGRPQPGKRGKIDYREILSEPDFAVFAKLRALRKTLAERERACPPTRCSPTSSSPRWCSAASRR